MPILAIEYVCRNRMNSPKVQLIDFYATLNKISLWMMRYHPGKSLKTGVEIWGDTIKNSLTCQSGKLYTVVTSRNPFT